MTYTAWSTLEPGPPYDNCSPNLLALGEHLVASWGGQILECYTVRPITGGTAWSSHAFGAALDWSYPDRKIMHDEVLPWLIHYAEQLGVQQIHDYGAARYWRNHSGWIGRPPGGGPDDSLHIETTAESWATSTTVLARLEPETTPVATKAKARRKTSG